jgi:hypothetical protein
MQEPTIEYDAEGRVTGISVMSEGNGYVSEPLMPDWLKEIFDGYAAQQAERIKYNIDDNGVLQSISIISPTNPYSGRSLEQQARSIAFARALHDPEYAETEHFKAIIAGGPVIVVPDAYYTDQPDSED